VVLTDAGARLLNTHAASSPRLGAHGRSWRTNATATRDTFALGLPPSLGNSVTGSAGESVRSKSSNARLATVEGLSAYILEWLNVGRVDCALVYNAARVEYGGPAAVGWMISFT